MSESSPFESGYKPTHTYEHHVKHNKTPAERGVETPLGVIVFETGTQEFHFIPCTEVKKLQAAIHWLTPAVQKLIQANANPPQNADEAQEYTQLKDYYNSVLKPLVHGEGKNDICELVSLTQHCWHYVTKEGFKGIAKQTYSVAKKDLQDAIMDNGKLSIHKLLAKLVGPQSFKYHGAVEGGIQPLADALGIKSENVHKVFFSNPSDKYMQYTGHADARLMRYSAGLGLKSGFNPQTGRFGFSAHGQAKVTLASADFSVTCYMPSEEGYHAEFLATLGKNSMVVDLGYVRVILGLEADAFVGAAVQANVTMKCKIDTDTGKLHVTGANVPAKYDKRNPPNFGVKASAQAFAGAKAGGSVSAECEWVNPEKAQANVSHPKHRDAGWDKLAAISAKGDVAAGIGLDGGFKIGYDPVHCKFVIHAEAGLVCGVGASGSVNVVVYEKHVKSFVHFIYHKLMQAEFYFLDIFVHGAFHVIINIFTKFILEAEKDIEHIFIHELKLLDNWWNTILLDMKDGVNLTNLYQLVDNINANPKRLKFTIPEVKGRFLYILTDKRIPQAIFDDAQANLSWWDYEKEGFHDLANWNWSDDAELNQKVSQFYKAKMHSIETAILNVLSYIQSRNEYRNVITHMSLNPLKKNGLTEGEHMLYEHLVNEGFDFSRLKHFKSVLAETAKNPANKTTPDPERLLIYAGIANYNEPVKPNKQVVNIIHNKLKPEPKGAS